jgi:hypothetical protein
VRAISKTRTGGCSKADVKFRVFSYMASQKSKKTNVKNLRIPGSLRTRLEESLAELGSPHLTQVRATDTNPAFMSLVKATATQLPRNPDYGGSSDTRKCAVRTDSLTNGFSEEWRSPLLGWAHAIYNRAPAKRQWNCGKFGVSFLSLHPDSSCLSSQISSPRELQQHQEASHRADVPA